MSNVWILVADGARANILNYSTSDKTLENVDNTHLEHVNKPSRELVSSERGRAFHSADGTRSAMERPTDPHQHEKAVFAAEVAQLLAASVDQFDKLVLIAAPRTLGDLRHNLPSAVKLKVVREIDKDLAGENPRGLQAHLHKLIDFREFHSQIH